MKHYLFTIDWSKENNDRSTNDVVRRYCKENKIDFHHVYFELVADFFGTGDFFKIDTTSNGFLMDVFVDDSKVYA